MPRACYKQEVRYVEDASILIQLTLILSAFFSCFFVWPFTARFGRRWSLVLASVIFNIGGILQVINTHSLAAFYVARVISGIGVGMATVIIPMFSAEMAPKHIRGSLGSMFQFFFTLGVMTSYWIDYVSLDAEFKTCLRQRQLVSCIHTSWITY